MPADCTSKPDKPAIDREVFKNIIQATIKGAYKLKDPSKWDYHGNPIKAKVVATQEQIDMVIHLVESLEPTNVTEAALASQFVITYIRGLAESQSEYGFKPMIKLFEFGHQVLETLMKYRSKGIQLINVQYNHNQGQINNIKIVEQNVSQPIIEVENER